MGSNLQRIHPVLWPLQLAGAVAVFATFLTGIAVVYVSVAAYETFRP